MSGICSAHQHHERGCVQCEAVDPHKLVDEILEDWAKSFGEAWLKQIHQEAERAAANGAARE